MTKLIIVRHGQSMANLNGTFAGQVDVPLSPLGHRQAEELKEYLTRRFKIDVIYSSALSRACDTVAPTAAALGLPVIRDAGLKEIDGGKWEGLTNVEIAQKFPADFALWRDNIGLSRCTGGESIRELQQRSIATTKRIAEENDGRTVLIGTHAGFLRAMICYWRGIPLEEMKSTTWVPNASVTEVDYEDGKFRLLQEGEISFLHGDVTRLTNI